jgi:Na+/H+ antiporter 1
VPIVGGLDIHRKQITFDYPGTETGQVRRGQIAPADRVHLRAWLARFASREARREFDLGELRERRRLALPLVVALGGIVVPIAIYLAINAGRSSASGWGTAMSTDTAFALGALALDELPDRAVVRVGERGDHGQRGLPGPRLRLAGHARDPARLRGGETGRHLRAGPHGGYAGQFCR